MRYGHQPLDVIYKLEMDEIIMWANEIADLVEAENGITNSLSNED